MAKPIIYPDYLERCERRISEARENFDICTRIVAVLKANDGKTIDARLLKKVAAALPEYRVWYDCVATSHKNIQVSKPDWPKDRYYSQLVGFVGHSNFGPGNTIIADQTDYFASCYLLERGRAERDEETLRQVRLHTSHIQDAFESLSRSLASLGDLTHYCVDKGAFKEL